MEGADHTQEPDRAPVATAVAGITARVGAEAGLDRVVVRLHLHLVAQRFELYSRVVICNEQSTETTQVVIEKLTKNVNEAHIREIFGTFGTIQDIDMPVNRQCKLFLTLRIFEFC